MDCNMKKMNGFVAASNLKEMIRKKEIDDIYIVACTGNTSEKDK